MSFNYIENYKDYLTDDFHLVLDLDSLCFNAASASESRHIEVMHKETKKGGLKFDKRTDFYGAKPKEIGGWLSQFNSNRVAQDLTPYEKSDFEIIDKQVPEPISYAIRNLQGMIKSYCNRFECHRLILVIEAKGCNNFRNIIPAQQEYKGNRKGTIRPVHLKELKQYVYDGKLKAFLERELYDPIIVQAKDREADDVINQLQTKSSLHYDKHGKHTHFVLGVDKDILSNPHGAILWNTHKHDGEYIHPHPLLYTRGLGKVWAKGNTVKGWGLLHFAMQMMLGDNVDNYHAKKNLCSKQYGATKFIQDVELISSGQEVFDLIERKYNEWFPDNTVKFKWKDTEYSLTVDEWLENQFKFVYMKRSQSDKTTYKSFKEEWKDCT